MASADFPFGAGDSLPLVTDFIEDEDSNPIDLTGATVTFPIEPIDGSSPPVVRTASIIGDPTLGAVSAKAFDPGDVSEGLFYGRFKVLLPSGDTLSWPRRRQYLIEVTEDGGDGSPAPAPTSPSWSVADIAALALSIPASDDAAVRVKTLRALFYLDRDSALTADDITVVAAQGGGRWIRQSGGDLYWQLRTAWFYDGTTGGDEATGADSGHPVTTMAEIWRRTIASTVLTDVTITIAGGPDSLSDAEATVFESLSQGGRQWSLA